MTKLIEKVVSCLKKHFLGKIHSMEENKNLPSDIDINGPNIIKDDMEATTGAINDEPSNNISEESAVSTLSETIIIEDNPTISDSVSKNDRNEIDKVFLSTLEIFDHGYVIGASIRGRSHELHDTPCQDYHVCEKIMEGWYILAVSDGAGSAKYAARGSKANSTFSARLVKQMLMEKRWIENDYFPTELEWYVEARAIFERIKLIIRTKVSELEDECVETDFNATLLIAVITPKGVLTAHIGDGRMGYLSVDNEWKAVMKPHKGEEANQTLFLQSGWTTPTVPAFNVSGIYVPETSIIHGIPKAVVLMSDGCERSSWECSIMDAAIGKYVDKNIPHKGFMDPLIEALGSCGNSDKIQLFVDILDHGTTACERELDDKTMLLAVFK